MSLSELSVRRPVFATMLTLALVVIGAVSYTRLGVDLLPEVERPTVTIFTSLPGAGPEEIETAISQPIEELLNTIAGIDEMRSVNREGFSFVRITFTLERDPDAALQDVRDKVSQVLRRLPEGTDPPTVSNFDADSMPILAVALSGPQSLRELTEFADTQVKDLLGTAPGVGQVSIEGGRKRAVNIWLDARKLESHGLTAEDVKRAVQSQNVEIPGGRVNRGEREDVLRTMARVERIRDFDDIIVATDPRTFAPIRLGDVATVEDGTEEVRGVSRLNGREAVTLYVQKQSGANLMTTAQAVKERLAELESILPAGSELVILQDASVFVEASAREVQNHLILGGILAALAVLLFMGSLRSTIIAAVAIPTSLIATFTAMYVLGYTLNNITLLALVLAVGIVIDDAIVVVENIHRHMSERGISAFRAAIEGTKEIALAISATTLSLVVIFAPIAFMSGEVGRLFSSYGVTVAVSVLISLLIALSLIPMLASRFLRMEAVKAAPKEGWRAVPDRLNHFLDERYERLVAWALDHRLVVGLVALGCVLLTIPLLIVVKKDFLPEDDQSEFQVRIELAPGTGLPATDALLHELEPRIAALPGVANVLASGGDTRGGSGSATRANIYVGLLPIEEREHSQEEIMRMTRAIFAGYPDLRVNLRSINTSGIGGGGGYGGLIRMNIRGPDLGHLETYLATILETMREDPTFVDVFSSSADRLPEVQVRIDRAKAADLGIDARTVAETLRILVGGEIISAYREGDERYDVWLRAKEEDRWSIQAIGRLPLRTRSGQLIPLENIAEIYEAEGPTVILRLGGQRQVMLSANPAPGIPLADALQRARQHVLDANLAPGYNVVFTGAAETMEETAIEFIFVLLLSMAFVYMVLAAQFESFIHPVTILLALPLTLPFALLSLVLLGESLNVYSALGLFLLLGIVKKNGILQVDYTNTLRAQGLPLREAILKANRARLRPILMTTITLIAAMLPMVFAQGAGAASRGSLAKVIVGGQLLSLVITLLIVPVAYAFFDDIQTRLKRRRPAPADEESAPTAAAG